MRDAAYRASVSLAREKDGFPALQTAEFLARPFIRRLPEELREDIRTHGIRNSHLLALAPTGSISLLAGNEPCFAGSVQRLIRRADGNHDAVALEDYALRLWRDVAHHDPYPPAFVTARELSPDDHLAMQATAQGFVDNAISKTINVPSGLLFEAFRDVYREAYKLGLKGCTVYRQGSRGRDILTAVAGAECIFGACRTEDGAV
jgi:ribonucleoside-diphosphate reductase alpha chain